MNNDTQGTTQQPIHFQPFANGMQHFAWQEANCCRCTRYRPDADGASTCDLETALLLGGENGDGLVDEQTARRCGYLRADGTTNGNYLWACGEVVWTEEWKEALAHKRGYANAAAMIAALTQTSNQ